MAFAAKSDDSSCLTRTARVRHSSVNFTVAIAILSVCLSSSAVRAQTNASPAASQPANRFLFIIETSRAMRPRAQAVFEAIKQALDSSLNGKIHQGDLVGIWTFNENVSQSVFPVQIWSQPTQLAFAVRLPTLADPENYLKRARLEKVISEMLKVISENDNVTIIFVSSGEGRMQGTPFNEKINATWKEWHDELEGVQRPLLTTLRARKGQPVDWLFTPAPRPILLPELAGSKTEEVKETNPVVLDSGAMTNKPEPISIAPEQQVAFSVSGLGRTSLVNTVTNHPITTANVENLATTQRTTSTTPTVTNASVEQPAQAANYAPPENDSPKIAITTPAPQEQVPAPQAIPTSEIRQISDNTTVATAPQKEAPAEPKKSTESTQPLMASPPRDLQMLAHARASNPEGEKPAQDSAVGVPRRNFVRENMNSLALMLMGAFGAAYSFKRWFLSQKRISRPTNSLAQEADEEAPEEVVEKKRPIRPRAAA